MKRSKSEVPLQVEAAPAGEAAALSPPSSPSLLLPPSWPEEVGAEPFSRLAGGLLHVSALPCHLALCYVQQGVLAIRILMAVVSFTLYSHPSRRVRVRKQILHSMTTLTSQPWICAVRAGTVRRRHQSWYQRRCRLPRRRQHRPQQHQYWYHMRLRQALRRRCPQWPSQSYSSCPASPCSSPERRWDQEPSLASRPAEGFLFLLLFLLLLLLLLLLPLSLWGGLLCPAQRARALRCPGLAPLRSAPLSLWGGPPLPLCLLRGRHQHGVHSVGSAVIPPAGAALGRCPAA